MVSRSREISMKRRSGTEFGAEDISRSTDVDIGKLVVSGT